jgi:hypothetical protein
MPVGVGMIFGGPGPVKAKRLKFRFRTRHRWLEGEIDTLNHRLIDVLNREDAEMGLLAEAVLAYDNTPTTDRHDHATVNLNNVLFAVPIEDAGAPPPGDPFARVKKEPIRMEIGIGPYTVTGNIFLLGGSSPREALRMLRSRFFAVTQVSLRHVDRSGFQEEQPVVFVNRGALDYILPVRLAARHPQDVEEIAPVD